MFSIPAVAHIKPVRREIRHRERVRQVFVGPFQVVKSGGIGAGDIAKLELPFAVEVKVLAEAGISGAKGWGTKEREGGKEPYAAACCVTRLRCASVSF